MRPLCRSAVLLGGVLLLSLSAAATTPRVAEVRSFDPPTLDRIEQSLAMALETRSPGMQASAALTLRQVRSVVPDRPFEGCVIPLMRIVKGEEYDVTSRICAAVALHELHSARGDFAILRTAEFTDSPRVKHVCEWLSYYAVVGE